MNYNKNSTCFCCGRDDLVVYFDIGETPLANSYPTEKTVMQTFPLRVAVCKNCYHSQLCESVNPDLLYRHYLYVSGTSETLKNYFKWFVDFVDTKQTQINSDYSILEIACNDGTLLELFRDKGWDVLGVDPALNLRLLTESKKLEVIADYWGETVAKKINRKFDAIVAQNVLAHLPYPDKFLELCCTVLKDSGHIYIQTSQADMVDNSEFDTIYHEHHSFFSAKSMKTLAERVGLKIIDVEKVPVHGLSYLFTLGFSNNHGENIYSLIEAESLKGRYEETTYDQFSSRVDNCMNRFLNVIEEHRIHGRKIIGYGAAAKGSTVSSYSKLKVDYIVDDNPLKWGHYAPDGATEIHPSAKLADEDCPITIIIFAWNFFDEIVKRIEQNFAHETKIKDFQYVTYFPELKLKRSSCVENK